MNRLIIPENRRLSLEEAPLWTPVRISTRLWLDASDVSTIVLASVTTVNRWNDKSGNGFNFSEGTVSLQPKYNTRTLNGLNIIDFDGVDQLTRASIGIPSVCMIIGMWDYDSGITLFSDNGSALPTQAMSITNTGFSLANDGGASFSSGSISGPSMISVVANGTTRIDAYKNGNLEASDTTLTRVIGNGGTLHLMTNFVGGSRGNGAMAEFLIIDGNDTDTRQKTEGYLAWKWGQVGKLPLTHPYKNARPLV